MSKMIIYFYLFIPLLFLSTDSSSIRDRSNKNELVPFLSSRVDPLKRDSNSLKIVSNEPFIIQLQMPSSREKESKRALEKGKKKKRPVKKRVSKIKPLRKKHRARRELLTPKSKIREQKSDQSEMPYAVNTTEQQLTNLTKNSINRMEILKALSSYSKKIETKRNKFEEIKNVEKVRHNAPSRNHHNRDFSLSNQTSHVKMIYPSTPKPDQHQHKYTYKDLMADRERLEQKIKYIKNMLNINDSATDDTVRVRRRSDSDRTANKIAKMFLTLSAVNGLHDRRKSKCREDEEEDDRMRDVWEKERRNNPIKKSSSSNEERYKVKKWIEYMKNKRSSSKTCPCMGNENGEESDIFPLEQKLPKGYFLRGKSSEESSESYSDPFYYSRDKLNNNNLKNRFEKYQDQENKLKALAKNGKKKLELPFDDLEVYRSRAKQILQNAEEILDRIKEEEEKRLQSPNILMNQLKELTSKIQTDPRNNENDLIRKIQKNLGWGALAKSNKETDDNSFIDNVKSFILDPYEKAKALTDESTKKLSSYLLRNLGKLQESSEEQEEDNQETVRENSQEYFEQIPQKENEKPVSASLAKEDFTAKSNSKEKEEGTLFVNLNSDDEFNNKSNQEDIFKQRVEDMIKEQQKKVNEYKAKQDSEEIDSFDERKVIKTGIETVGESESERNLGNEEVTTKLKEKEINENEEKTKKLMNSDLTKKIETEEATRSTEDATLTLKKISENSDSDEKKKKNKIDETSQEKKDQTDVIPAENMPAQEDFERKIKETMKTNYEKDNNDKLDLVVDGQKTINTDEREKEENAKNEDVAFQESEEQKLGRKRENEEQNHKEYEIEETTVNAQETSSGENTGDPKTANQKKRQENVLLSSHYYEDDNNEDSETPFKANEHLKYKAEWVLDGTSDETKSSKETILQNQEKAETQTNEENNEENLAKTILGENNFVQDNVKEPSQYDKENIDLKKSFNEQSVQSQELLEKNEEQNPSNVETTQTDTQHKDLMEESNHEYNEYLESSHSKSTENSLKSDEQLKDKLEEKREKSEDQNLTLENPDNTINQANEDERDKEKADDGTEKEISENPEKLGKKLDEREDQENLNEDDMDTPLRETLEENSNEDLGESEKAVQESQESLDGANEDNKQLQVAKFENRENEITENSVKNETSLEEDIPFHENEKHDNTTLEAKKLTEELTDESLDKSKNEDVNGETLRERTPLEKENKNNAEIENDETSLGAAMNEKSDKKDSDAEEVDETTLRETISKEDIDEEVNKKLINSNEEDSSETFLKSHLNEDKDLESSLKTITPNQNINESNDGETGNTVKEISDKIFPKDFEKEEEDGKQSSLKSKSQEENEKDAGNLNETDDETMVGLKNKEADRLNKNDEKETVLSSEIPQSEDWSENQNHKLPLSSQEQDMLKEEKSKEIISKEEKSEKNNQENQSSENSDEKDREKTLKAYLNKQSQENPEISDSANRESEQDGKPKESSEETLKKVLVKETQKNSNESPDDETLKAAKLNEELKQNQENFDDDETYLKSTLKDNDQERTEEMNDDEIIKEASSNKSEQRQNNFSNENTVEKTLDNQKQTTEMNDDRTEKNLNENKSSQDEENLAKADYEDTPLTIANPREDENNTEMDLDSRISSENDREENSLESAVESQKQENKEMHIDETLQAENPQEDQEKEALSSEGDGTLLKTTSTENELDNKMENYEIPLKSAKAEKNRDDTELIQDESEETLREENISDDLSNQIDQENENENPLTSKHFDEINEEESGKNSQESYETPTAGKPSIENQGAEDDYEPQLKAATLVSHDNSPNSQEEQTHHRSVSDFIQKTDSTKTDKLKVPTSIGKIMKALEGKEKDDITSFRNLNPDKIDHIIDKIDEAEQQNLRQSLEVDCRKECACADEIDTKSRNMGRYEIVKDFLFWMKDLQLNRVLNDD